ncbi:protein farnesyltransferase/geranylgeranyltransferase type-1 subunit alpha [Coffea eugenioides]|uniref:Uncharacterized protein n=1 Tax=Coffea arabica TaxID=13443 RepID=A0A6P6WIY1_COFAR|nr:protein farnesyltransferase/geranylgeranyltransferase type-1 subunit alpha-like [Coffea arabica]XP_027160920.1 protein farnesyltransferase/geranylgeranyltransferase type-1 subunit alpha [Coffea eugenioides]
METAQTAPNHQNLPPQQPPPPPPAAPPTASPPSDISTGKRPLDDDILARLVDSPYYKMRVIVRDLRPHFIEVLKTPDFQNCKAAEEIREKMKIVVDLYREMIRDPPASQTPTADVQHGQDHQRDVKLPERPPSDRASTRQAENKTVSSGGTSQKQQPEAGRPEGTYIVGGSAFGWNFVTYPGTKSVYYGRTKESFRSAKV